MRDGLVDDMGRTAVIEAGGVTLLLTERKLPQWNLEQLRSAGIEPARQRIVVCKGAVAHRAAYEPIASRMIEVETSGSCAGDVRRFSYHNIRRPLYPIDRW
jgi:microcystin degradation protein MlrC